MTIIERARALIAKAPPSVSGQGGHAAAFRVASALVWGFGLSPEEAFPLMLEFNNQCQPLWTEHELWHKLRSALGASHREPRGHFLTEPAERGELPSYAVPKRRKAVEFDLEALKKAQMAGLQVDHAWLRQRSPYDPRKLTAGQMIDLLYLPEDKVMLFTSMQSRGDYMRWRGRWYQLGKTPEQKATPVKTIPERSAEGMIWLVQPVDGLWHPKAGGVELSRRTKKSITRFPYLLLESDAAPVDLWLNVMVRLALPIVLITTSAGRSVHMLVKVEAETHDEWLALVTLVRDKLARIGCDTQALANPAVNVRCPNTWREGKMMAKLNQDGTPVMANGRPVRQLVPFSSGPGMQRCLYFNPTAGMSAIMRQPLFDHDATSA